MQRLSGGLRVRQLLLVRLRRADVHALALQAGLQLGGSRLGSRVLLPLLCELTVQAFDFGAAVCQLVVVGGDGGGELGDGAVGLGQQARVARSLRN